MSKLSIITLISCAIVIPSAMADFGHGSNPDTKGKVNFTGHVYANSCKIEAGDKDQKVNLNPVLNTLVKKSHATQLQPFSIRVKNCYINGNATPKLSWNGNSNLTKNGYLKNMTSSGDKNVALVITDNKQNIIDLNKNSNRFGPEEGYLRHENGSRILTYKFNVGYIIAEGNNNSSYVKPGPVSAQANYSITYL